MTQQKNGRIMAEFHYWSYGKFSETAMQSRPEVEEEELKRIAKKHYVNISSRNVSSVFWSPSRIGRFPRYSKVIIEVTGYDEEPIKNSIREIFNTYGRPDEIPSPLFGEKRIGKKIIDEVLMENMANY